MTHEYMHFEVRQPSEVTRKANELHRVAGWKLITVTEVNLNEGPSYYTAFLEREL